MVQRAKKLWSWLRQAMQQKLVRRLLYAGIVLLSLAFIAYFINANWSQLRDQEWTINIVYLILAVILYPLGMFPTVAAWHWLLRAFSAVKPFFLNLRLYALSSLPRHIPGLVWYVTSRTLLYEEHGVRVSVVLAATAFETAMLALSGFITAILIIPLHPNLPEQFNIIRYLIPISVIILVLIFVWAPGSSTLLDKMLKRWQIAREGIQFKRSGLWASLAWMFTAWLGGGILLWISVSGITPIGLDLLPLMVGIWGVAGAVSLTIGLGLQGLGLREVTLGALLSTVISPIEAITAAIAFRLILTIGELLWVFLISIIIKDKPANINSESTSARVN
jgi:uncharacterized membrane protein YbhN (UPF0104 family)